MGSNHQPFGKQPNALANCATEASLTIRTKYSFIKSHFQSYVWFICQNKCSFQHQLNICQDDSHYVEQMHLSEFTFIMTTLHCLSRIWPRSWTNSKNTKAENIQARKEWGWPLQLRVLLKWRHNHKECDYGFCNVCFFILI